ncbi:4'-phosphopantetheinyl transferase family protein [Streptomyces gobiensis]|uniref:4'-phosphopantetheinyl transferase family protein n=1 Tax=Streptomyces gobiensis TaxID=2875706 RepID=UPI001E47CF2A|nr:4'-phosphopantetheinyl transferase superfamily protein [Streptomyces gobiensis]UGY92578.1 4'-phosphopantetheinyl transferase superfamily protein [Streptomyces gobiensis]
MAPTLLHTHLRCPAGQVELWWHTSTVPPRLGSGRRLLTLAASHALHLPPQQIPLYRDEAGRPALLRPRGLPPIGLSVSHSSLTTVAALAEGFSVGIDIEATLQVPGPPLLRMALTALERAELSLAPPHDKTAAFHQIWTAKEAVAKAIGWPLVRSLVDIEVALHPRPHLERLGKDSNPNGWQLSPLTPPQQPAVATLAVLAPFAGPGEHSAPISEGGRQGGAAPRASYSASPP